jgi:purine-binding chemotaxis protein CheW
MQFTSFYVGDNLLGVDAKQVQEVLHYQKITPVSLMPDYVRGLLNLRGQIVTVLDLRSLFGLPPVEDESFRMFLVVQEEQEAICLFVDRMHTIVDVRDDRLFPPPGRVQDAIARYVREVCQLDDDLLLILDLERVLQQEEPE